MAKLIVDLKKSKSNIIVDWDLIYTKDFTSVKYDRSGQILDIYNL